MAGEIFDFEWYVHADGYEWIEAEFAADTSGPAVIPEDGDGRVPWITAAGEPTSLNLLSRRKYYPLRDHSCLFRVFAETGTDRESITGFADRYGLLGVDLDPGGGREGPFVGTAEPVSAWELEIRAMQRAVGLWDMVSNREEDGLAAYLQPFVKIIRADMDGEPGEDRADGRGNGWLAGELRWFRTHPEIAQMYDAGVYAAAALNRVQALVNERLGARVSPRILWDDPNRNEWGLYFVPGNLIGAIWIQFAQAITENRDYRRCRQCDTWFEIDHYKARTNRYFCSNACRSKAYRERQQEAVRMSAAGMSTEAIAARLGSDVNTVARWLS